MGWGGGWGGKGKGLWTPWQPMFWGKGKGKGWGGGSFKVDPALKVWIGNLAAGVDWKALQDHMNQAGKTKWCEVFKGKSEGTGAVVYTSAEEATNAITMLNGSVVGGQAIMVDVWVKQEKPEEAAAAAS
eukprot:TRINITY_DN3392_c0_g1_i4.p1 TRINITY_DN3392_c0_g1~~TRINITY_DN3392_c0_g1_i4.p1  ORF type:complete len:129 (+),score=41.55 TRINITY_DN3392_c0_g1_i4:60-446(+)